jgi:GTP:adenosylcobinamide-phosphate guanylyltransferase
MNKARQRVIVIPAHGQGTRLRDVTAGRAKTLMEVAGEPILARLLRAAEAAEADGAHVVVYARPSDADVPACAAAYGTGVQVSRREPMGYLNDLMDIARDVGDEFTVLDCDLVAPHAEVAGFIAGTAQHKRANMLFAVSASPPSADPRSIRVTADSEGAMGLGDGADSQLPRAVGAYHWRPAAVALGRQFAGEGRGTFHAYIEFLAVRREPVAVVPFAFALNVNTSAELDLARRLVQEWRAQGLE